MADVQGETNSWWSRRVWSVSVMHAIHRCVNYTLAHLSPPTNQLSVSRCDWVCGLLSLSLSLSLMSSDVGLQTMHSVCLSAVSSYYEVLTMCRRSQRAVNARVLQVLFKRPCTSRLPHPLTPRTPHLLTTSYMSLAPHISIAGRLILNHSRYIKIFAIKTENATDWRVQIKNGKKICS